MYDLYQGQSKHFRKVMKKMAKTKRDQAGVKLTREQAAFAKKASTSSAHIMAWFVDNAGVIFTQSTDFQIMLQERVWERKGHVTVFPESVEFLEMLWDAKMDVSISDLEPTDGPIAIAWPSKASICDGLLRPCIVQVDTAVGRANQWRKALVGVERVLGRKFTEVRAGNADLAGMGAEFQVMLGTKNVVNSPEISQTLIYESDADFAFKSQEEYEKMHGELESKDPAWFRGTLSKKERLIDFVNQRLALRLVAYMQSFPDKVVKGYPDKVLGRLGKLPAGGIEPVVLKGPEIQKTAGDGTRTGPKTHIRQWHFRRYPLRKDGTRTKGVVFVNSSIVNEDVDPRTVIS